MGKRPPFFSTTRIPDGDQTHRGLLHRSVWTWTRSKIIGDGIVCSHILFGRVSFGGHSLVGTWRTCETTAARLGPCVRGKGWGYRSMYI